MDQKTFESRMALAKTMENGDRSEYWRGFQLGLQRCFYGEQFGTEEQHAVRMAAINSLFSDHQETGRGYRDGFLGHDPE